MARLSNLTKQAPHSLVPRMSIPTLACRWARNRTRGVISSLRIMWSSRPAWRLTRRQNWSKFYNGFHLRFFATMWRRRDERRHQSQADFNQWQWAILKLEWWHVVWGLESWESEWKSIFRLLATGVLAKGVRHGNEAWMKRWSMMRWYIAGGVASFAFLDCRFIE